MNQQKELGLFWDIETSPIISYNWGIYEQNAIEVIEDFQILTVAWQWMGEKKVFCKGQDDFKSYKPGINNDYELVKFIRDELLDKCDYAVAHNGDRFDVKKLNTRMMIHGLMPPAPYRQVDTKKMAKQVGAFTSNRLAHLAKDLEVNLKGDSGGFGTWKGCLAGEKRAWKQMKKYNRQDIPPLMDLYLKFRPWAKTVVPLNVLLERPTACPRCGIEGHMRAGTKYRATNTNLYQYYRCFAETEGTVCGGMAKRRIAEYKQTEERMSFTN